jgi:hypothetical protein
MAALAALSGHDTIIESRQHHCKQEAVDPASSVAWREVGTLVGGQQDDVVMEVPGTTVGRVSSDSPGTRRGMECRFCETRRARADHPARAARNPARSFWALSGTDRQGRSGCS